MSILHYYFYFFKIICDDVGVEHVGGDMFVNIPKGDAILLKVKLL